MDSGANNNEVKLEIEKRRNNLMMNHNFMYQNVSFAIISAQFFGLMPLYGLSSNQIHDMQFKWVSLRSLYTALNLIRTFAVVIICFAKVFISGIMLDKSTFVAFYSLNFLSMLQFVRIARNWDEIMREWTNVEISMKSYEILPSLKKRFKFIFSVVMILAFIEHMLFILNNIIISRQCRNSAQFPTKIYFGIAFQPVFTTIGYAHWKAIIMEVENILCTFAWNYTDLFIMLVSYGLAVRFKQIVERLETKLVTNVSFWKEIREDYNRLAQLCHVVDKYIAPLVIVSFINNLYFICIQLYNSMKPRSGLSESVYFSYSFGFLLGRTIAVSSYAAWINDESRRPLEFIHSVSSECYDIEVNRLVFQIYTCPVGITGAKYFVVTRSFLLRVFGTIITFELMLMQFGPLLNGQERVYSEKVCIK